MFAGWWTNIPRTTLHSEIETGTKREPFWPYWGHPNCHNHKTEGHSARRIYKSCEESGNTCSLLYWSCDGVCPWFKFIIKIIFSIKTQKKTPLNLSGLFYEYIMYQIFIEFEMVCCRLWVENVFHVLAHVKITTLTFDDPFTYFLEYATNQLIYNLHFRCVSIKKWPSCNRTISAPFGYVNSKLFK